MQPYEARKTDLLEFTNNVAHSNIGVCIIVYNDLRNEIRQSHVLKEYNSISNELKNFVFKGKQEEVLYKSFFIYSN